MSSSNPKHEMNSLLDIEQGHSIEEFIASLATTKSWYSLNVNENFAPNEVFRTYLIRPSPLYGSRKDVVDSVLRRRDHKLFAYTQKIAGNLQHPITHDQGRLLVYIPDMNLTDGAAESETDGFFDVDNVPPWDTWIAYIHENTGERYLIAWIPNKYVSLAESGISVNPEECIYWLDENRNLLTKFLFEINSEQ